VLQALPEKFIIGKLNSNNYKMGLFFRNRRRLKQFSVSGMGWMQAGELVAQFKATVLLMPNGSDRITAAPLQELRSARAVEDPELRKLLLASMKSKKKSKPRKGKEKKKSDADAAAAGGGEAMEVDAKGGAKAGADDALARP